MDIPQVEGDGQAVHSHPFHDEYADIILRSSDGVDFRIHRIIIAKASPIFKDMFEVAVPDSQPQGSRPNDAEGIPCVTVTENASTLESILRFCYPTEPPVFTTLGDLYGVIETVTKYQMFALHPRMKHAFANFVDKEPLRVYFLAAAQGLLEEAQTAARCSLRGPMRPLPLPFPELRTTSSSVFYALLEYRFRCVEAARATTTNLQWVMQRIPDYRVVVRQKRSPEGLTYNIFSTPPFLWIRCRACATQNAVFHISRAGGGGGGSSVLRPTCWWWQYLCDVRVALEDKPVGAVAMQRQTMTSALTMAGKCATCGPHALVHLLEFSKHLAAQIDDAVKEIKLNLTV